MLCGVLAIPVLAFSVPACLGLLDVPKVGFGPLSALTLAGIVLALAAIVGRIPNWIVKLSQSEDS